MEGSNLHAYSYPPRQPSPGTIAARHSAAYQNSSAFSASANPDEDWTQISDLAERRRIQNRIAQRNYRKKLKRRLEDLEKRTASTSPDQRHRPNGVSSSPLKPTPSRSMAHRRASRVSISSRDVRCSPEIMQNEEWIESRPLNGPSLAYISAPPTYNCTTTYPLSSTYFTDAEYPSAGLQQVTSNNYTLPHAHSPSIYPQATVSMVSPMLPYPQIELESDYGRPPMFTPLDMTYASLAGINVTAGQLAEDCELRTPPLTDSMSHFDSSRECSPAYLDHSPPYCSPSPSPNMQYFLNYEPTP